MEPAGADQLMWLTVRPEVPQTIVDRIIGPRRDAFAESVKMPLPGWSKASAGSSSNAEKARALTISVYI